MPKRGVIFGASRANKITRATRKVLGANDQTSPSGTRHYRARQILPVLLSGAPVRDGSNDRWTYTGYVLQSKPDGVDPDLYEKSQIDDDPPVLVNVVNDMEFASNAGSIAADELDGTHHQTGATNGTIAGTCKVLPFRPGAVVHCYILHDVYHFSLPNTIGPE